jgi:hypothetical protein
MSKNSISGLAGGLLSFMEIEKYLLFFRHVFPTRFAAI